MQKIIHEPSVDDSNPQVTEPRSAKAHGFSSSELAETELGAWLLPIGQGLCVAVGRYELKYIEYISDCVSLPGVPGFCEHGFLWRGHFIPLLDLCGLITRRRPEAVQGEMMVAILAYENGVGKIELGAILLRGVPKLTGVDPEQSVALSSLQSELQLLALAAFLTDEGIYPVVDLRALFDSTPADVLSLH